MFSFYSEDSLLIGRYYYTYVAWLTDFPQHEYEVESYVIVGDPCPDPNSVLAPNQMALEPYMYTSEPIVEFVIEPFIVDPPSCYVVYECLSIDAPLIDGQSLCDFQRGDDYGQFIQTMGIYQMRFTDASVVPPGEYKLQFTGTVGTKSDSFELSLVFVDLCPNVQITVLEDGLFQDSDYLIRGEEQV